MRPSRLVAGLVTAGLVGFVPIAISAPANADTIGSATTLTVSPPFSSANFEVGDSLYFNGTVRGADGTSTPNSGTATLQVYTPATPAWTSIATDSSPSSLYFPDVKATTNAQFKVVFSGGPSGYGSSADTLTPSESVPVAVAVTRKVKLKTNRLKVSGKVTPDYAKKKVKVLRKAGKKFKKFAAVKTDKKGRFVFNAPRRNKFKFVLVIPGDASFVAVPSNVYTVRIF